MAKKGNGHSKNGSAYKSKAKPRSGAILDGGIHTGAELMRSSIAVAADLANGRLTPSQGNAICANLRNTLKTAELTIKYGQMSKAGQKTLQLTAIE